MLTYDPFKIAKAHLELWNNHNPVPYKELLAPGATIRFSFVPQERPAPKFIEEYETLVRTACPDVHAKHIDIIAAEGSLTLEWVIQATHTGKVLEIEPTGRMITLQGTTVLKVNEDGKIVRETIFVDLTALLTQIGMNLTPIPEPQRLRQLALTLIETVNHRQAEKLVTFFTPRPEIMFNAMPVDEARLNELLIRNLVALPDLKLQANQIAVRGTEVVLEVVGTATHTGPILEFEPTNKPIKLEGCLILSFVGEKVAKLRFYGDQYNLLVQIGKVPEIVLR